MTSADESKEVITAFQRMREMSAFQAAQAKNYKAEAMLRSLRSENDVVVS